MILVYWDAELRGVLTNKMAKLIHIVGTSGSGKQTLQQDLRQRVERAGFAVEEIVEPGPLARFIKEYRLSPEKDPWVEVALFTADRTMTYAQKILPRIHDPNRVFVSARGLPDTIVYQGLIGGVDIPIIMRMNRHIPESDLYLVLVVSGNVGHERIRARYCSSGRDEHRISPNEQPAAIDKLAAEYRTLPDFFHNVHVIDTTSLSPEEVGEAAWKEVESVLKK